MSTNQKKPVVVTIDISQLDFFKDRTNEEIKIILTKIAALFEYHSFGTCQEVFLDCMNWMPCTDWFELKKEMDRFNCLTIIKLHVELYNQMNLMATKANVAA
jgi:hypothetical protein